MPQRDLYCNQMLMVHCRFSVQVITIILQWNVSCLSLHWICSNGNCLRRSSGHRGTGNSLATHWYINLIRRRCIVDRALLGRSHFLPLFVSVLVPSRSIAVSVFPVSTVFVLLFVFLLFGSIIGPGRIPGGGQIGLNDPDIRQNGSCREISHCGGGS